MSSIHCDAHCVFARAWRNTPPMRTQQKKVGFVSLGCPKALVDSQRILSELTADGYATAAAYEDADVVVVNTCGFLDSARDESLDAIGEALAENGKVIVTGCLGAQADLIRDAHPGVTAVTGPHQYEAVVEAFAQQYRRRMTRSEVSFRLAACGSRRITTPI